MMTRTRWIPQGSQAITHPDGLAVVYWYPARGNFGAIAYVGKAAKAAWHYSVKSMDRVNELATQLFKNLEEHRVRIAERRAERTKPHTLKIGDIIHHSWGWEQTQCDYYQVLSVTPHTAIVRALRSLTVHDSIYPHGMAEMQTCQRDDFAQDAEPFRVTVSGQNYVGLEHGSAGLWDGKPNYCSWYA